MNTKRKNRVCPVEHAGVLDFNLRKLIHNPVKILKPYVKKGMSVLDLGCGPGFFTIEIAKLVGNSGKVIGADLQGGMLEKLKGKIQNLKLEKIIKLHKCQKDKIGLSEKVDFVLIFYMLHEVPNQYNFMKEVKTLLKPDGRVLVVEPNFHVSQSDFQKSLDIMKQNGFDVIEGPKLFLSRSIMLKSGRSSRPRTGRR